MCAVLCVCVCMWCVCVCVSAYRCVFTEGSKVRPPHSHLLEQRSVELWLQLIVSVAVDDLCDLLLSPDVGRGVRVALQTPSPAHVDDCRTHQEP